MPRFGHVIVIMENGNLVIIGGARNAYTLFIDIYTVRENIIVLHYSNEVYSFINIALHYRLLSMIPRCHHGDQRYSTELLKS